MRMEAAPGTRSPVRRDAVAVEVIPVSHGRKADPRPATKKMSVLSEYCKAMANRSG